MTISAAGSTGADLPISWASLSAESGGDPTREWRRRHAEMTVRSNGVCPPGLELTFVLAFACDVLATAGAYAAALGPWLLDLSPEQVSFALAEPWTHPREVRLRRGSFAVEADPDARRERARAAYETVAVPFADGYATDARMSSHQRRGIVADTWDLAWARATGTGVVQREACCLIYALPGCHECAGCPRLRPT
ncbi:MAG: (2Fe-2S)-binding protein [Nostocoides sp.]